MSNYVDNIAIEEELRKTTGGRRWRGAKHGNQRRTDERELYLTQSPPVAIEPDKRNDRPLSNAQ